MHWTVNGGGGGGGGGGARWTLSVRRQNPQTNSRLPTSFAAQGREEEEV